MGCDGGGGLPCRQPRQPPVYHMGPPCQIRRVSKVQGSKSTGSQPNASASFTAVPNCMVTVLRSPVRYRWIAVRLTPDKRANCVSFKSRSNIRSARLIPLGYAHNLTIGSQRSHIGYCRRIGTITDNVHRATAMTLTSNTLAAYSRHSESRSEQYTPPMDSTVSHVYMVFPASSRHA